ncbi:MAG: Cytidine deaminase [Firmicutes bacterium ADurb.Bin300]|nr:MAG: Cytidine deaminase [Firmicutes bacterium ADurb.Bin300]HOD03185.1 cytidine deaminase [Clostridiales bacterium]
MDGAKLAEMAVLAMRSAYSPYSGFAVGAALLTKSGRVYLGCNIENASFSPSVCAERTAFFKALSEGEREFEKIAVVGGKDGMASSYCSPCGVCRQVMAEFCPGDFIVIMRNKDGSLREKALKELLPEPFEFKIK